MLIIFKYLNIYSLPMIISTLTSGYDGVIGGHAITARIVSYQIRSTGFKRLI